MPHWAGGPWFARRVWAWNGDPPADTPARAPGAPGATGRGRWRCLGCLPGCFPWLFLGSVYSLPLGAFLALAEVTLQTGNAGNMQRPMQMIVDSIGGPNTQRARRIRRRLFLPSQLPRRRTQALELIFSPMTRPCRAARACRAEAGHLPSIRHTRPAFRRSLASSNTLLRVLHRGPHRGMHAFALILALILDRGC